MAESGSLLKERSSAKSQNSKFQSNPKIRVNLLNTIETSAVEGQSPPPNTSFNAKRNEHKSDGDIESESEESDTSIYMSGVGRNFNSKVNLASLVVQKHLSKHNIVQGIQTLRGEKKVDLDDLDEDIADYFYVDKEQSDRSFTKDEMFDFHFAICYASPLIGIFLYEYFLGTSIAGWLYKVATSHALTLMETFQYVPLIMNLRHYKIPGDVEQVSCLMHIYFHLVMMYTQSSPMIMLIHALLLVQQLYVTNLIWTFSSFSARNAAKALQNGFIILTGLLGVDMILDAMFVSSVPTSLFRGSIIILIQAVRYLPQYAANEKSRHCAVESVESNLMAALPALAGAYLGLLELNGTLFVGNSLCVAMNSMLTYQILIHLDDSKGYIEREMFLASQLPEVGIQDYKRSVSLKFKPRGSVDSFALSEGSRTVFSDADKSNENDYSNEHGRFDLSPML